MKKQISYACNLPGYECVRKINIDENTDDKEILLFLAKLKNNVDKLFYDYVEKIYGDVEIDEDLDKILKKRKLDKFGGDFIKRYMIYKYLKENKKFDLLFDPKKLKKLEKEIYN